MKQEIDGSTLDMFAQKKRGRKPLYSSASDRQTAFRERHNLKAFTVNLPVDLVDQFNEFLKFKDVKRDAVIEKLLRSQLLRKR